VKKSTLFLIILVAILFTSTLVLLYLNLFRRTPLTTSTSPTISSIPTVTLDPTANWKTYKNEEYKLKYPPEMTIADSKDILSLGNKEYSLIIKKTNLSNIASWIQTITDKNRQGNPSVDVIMTRGLIFYKESRQSSGSTFERNVFIETDKAVYWLAVSSDDTNPGFSYQNVEDFVDQILSTFETTHIKTGPDKYDGSYVSQNGNILAIQTNAMGTTEISGIALWTDGSATNEEKIIGLINIVNNKADFYDNGCDIYFEFNQNVITAKEKNNSTCGGLNISFDGKYFLQ